MPQDRSRPPRPTLEASTRARLVWAAPTTPRPRSGPWRSGCSRGRPHGVPPSTICCSREECPLWDLLHHIHTVVRCFYIPTMIEANVFGSMMVLPCRQEGSADQFDFGDLHFGQTMMLRLGSTAI